MDFSASAATKDAARLRRRRSCTPPRFFSTLPHRLPFAGPQPGHAFTANSRFEVGAASDRAAWELAVYGAGSRPGISTLPWRVPPSARTRRGEDTSPTTEPVPRISSLSVAVTGPLIVPVTTTVLAVILAFTLARPSMVSVWSGRLILPSTHPRTIKSSDVLRSPLIPNDSQIPFATLSAADVMSGENCRGAAVGNTD